MSISIITKFLGPTNHRSARVAATVSDYGSEMQKNAESDGSPGRIVVDWRHGVGVEENHKRAAFALAKRLEWEGEWTGGEAPGSAGYIFVRQGGCNFTVEAVSAADQIAAGKVYRYGAWVEPGSPDDLRWLAAHED